MKHSTNKSRTSGFALILAVSLGLTSASTAQQVLFVRADASGAGTGASWADAFPSLQDALDAATSGHEIWVAAGTYTPDQGANRTPGDRTLSFEMRSGVRIHGGFSGSETSRVARDVPNNPTILTGDLAADDDGLAVLDDNSYHVVRADDIDASALLDGFIIVAGNADGSAADSLGGGILIIGGSPWIANTRVNSSYAECGGGIAVTNGGTPTLINGIIHGNAARIGGGICNRFASPNIINSTITANLAEVAAGIYNNESNPTIHNSIVAENRLFADVGACVMWQFPCSSRDVSPEILARSAEVIDGAAAAGSAGSMADALAFLENHTDVVQAFGNSTAVAARVKGGPLEFITDGRYILAEASAASKTNTTANMLATAQEEFGMRQFSVDPIRQIVGQDLNGDGKIDNHDGKRALVLAPFLGGNIDLVVTALEELPDYRGRVEYVGPNQQTSNVTLDAYRTWYNYDLIYLNAPGMSIEFDGPSGYQGIEFNVITGIPWTALDQSAEETGISRNTIFGLDNNYQGFALIRQDFFKEHYNGELTDRQLYCAACQLANNYFATLLGRDKFFAAGWSGSIVSLGDAGQTNLKLFQGMAEGLSHEDALNELDPELASIPTPGGNAYPIAWSQYPDRIIELPILNLANERVFVDPDQIYDGLDITDLDVVIGTIGDDVPDQMRLGVSLKGVAPGDENRYSFVYVVNDNLALPVGLSGDAQLRNPDGFEWLDGHTINLGFDVKPGVQSLEVFALFDSVPISRYSAQVSAATYSCSASNSFGGFHSGVFTGAASWNYLGDASGFSELNLESAHQVFLAADPEAWLGSRQNYNVNMVLSNPVLHYVANTTVVEYIEYTVEAAGITHRFNEYWSSTNSGESSLGPATVRVDSTTGGGTIWHGTAEFTGRELFGSSSDLTTSKIKFHAAVGSSTDGTSPYFKCLEEYWELLAAKR